MAQPGPQQLVRVYDTANSATAFQQEAERLLAEGWIIQSQNAPTPGQMIVVYARAMQAQAQVQAPAITITNNLVANPVQTTFAPRPVAPPYYAPPPVYRPQPAPRQPQVYVPTPRNYGLDNLSPTALKLHRQKFAVIGIVVTALVCLLLLATSAGVFSLLWLGIIIGLLVVDARNAVTLHGLLRWGQWFRNHPIWTTIVTFFLGGYALLLLFGPIVYFVQCYQLAPRVHEMEQKRLEANIKELEAELLPRGDAGKPQTQQP